MLCDRCGSVADGWTSFHVHALVTCFVSDVRMVHQMQTLSRETHCVSLTSGLTTTRYCSVMTSHHPLSFNRQHLSYDVCLEVRGEIIRTVLCCIVY